MFKKFITVLAIMFVMAMPAMALDLIWEANPASDNVKSYTVYWEATDGSDGPYNMSTPAIELTIPDEYFVRGVEYTLYAIAHNDMGQSSPSNTVTNNIPVHEVPADVLPSTWKVRPVSPTTFTRL